MPLGKIVAKAVVGSIKGKKAGEAAAAAAAKKAAAAKAAKAKKAAAAKAIKAAKATPSLTTPKSGVNVIKPGTKPLTKPTSPYIYGQPMSGTRRSIEELQRMGYTTKELRSMGLIR
jgi:hypothetical protein